jgi:type II secretory pathway pseudopilin PulG
MSRDGSWPRRPGQGTGQSRRGTDDRGESLLELLIAVVIMGIAVVAIVGGLSAATLVSDQHRKEATAGSYARDYAEAVQSMSYTDCATPASYPVPAGLVPAGYSASVQSVQYWPISGTNWQTTCPSNPDKGLQRLTVQVASSDGRAAERVTLVLRKPCGPGSSC